MPKQKGIIVPLPGGGRTMRYELTVVELDGLAPKRSG